MLQDVDLDLLPGEVHALMGANGAGKSTLACIISGLVQPDAGSMMLERSSYRPAGKAAAESLGVMKPVKPDQRLWYRRTFELAPPKQGQRWLLHFGAVDWDSTVIFNGRNLGTHRGGYDPFTFDITDGDCPERNARAGRLGLGPDRCGEPAARQAGAQAGRNHVHRQHRDLADRLARAGSGDSDRSLEDRSRSRCR